MSSGTATWYFHYDAKGPGGRIRRKQRIGRYDEIGLADAISVAEDLRHRVGRGADPAHERALSSADGTFAIVAEERLARGKPLGQGTEYDYRLLLRRDIVPAIGNIPIGEVQRQHVITLVDAVADRGSTRRADTAKHVVSSVFDYAMDRGYTGANPAAGLSNRHHNRPRDVILEHDQIRCLWRAMEAGDAIMTSAVAYIVRLALLTAQRRSEIASIRQDDIRKSVDGWYLELPRGRQRKNENMHQVPLSPQARRIVEQALADAGNNAFLFPSEPVGHITARSVSKAIERTRERLGLGNIRFHDLRRTVGTEMAKFGVPHETRQRVLNHGGSRSRGVTDDVYGWYDYMPEKRAALELWGDALDCILDGGGGSIENFRTRIARLKGADRITVG
jgi:integrase